MSGPERHLVVVASDLPKAPRLTVFQQNFFLECAGFRKRMASRLHRRWHRWFRREEVEDVVTAVVASAITRFEESEGVPFEGYALKACMYEMTTLGKRRQGRERKAHLAGASCGEVWMCDPAIVMGTEEERVDTLQRLADEGITAMFVAGHYSAQTAVGGEEGMIQVLDGQRAGRAVEQLDMKKQNLLFRRYGQEATAKDIAKELGIGVMTLRKEHSRALAELRALLIAPEEETPETSEEDKETSDKETSDKETSDEKEPDEEA